MASCAVCVVMAVGVVAAQGQSEARLDRLDPSIGPPRPERFQSIRDGQDWLNPYLQLCSQGVIVSVRSVNRVRDTMPISALRSTLLELPVRAWPYGRIVALQECSVFSSADSAQDRETRGREVEAVLRELELAISYWPS
jgi:hypothetical protein